jgi:hypothetical protein
MGHSRPMHSVPVPINVRSYSNSNIIVRRSEVTLRARSCLSRCKKDRKRAAQETAIAQQRSRLNSEAGCDD